MSINAHAFVPQNPTGRGELEMRPGESIGQHYQRLVGYIRREYDPRFPAGVHSVVEYDRVKAAIARFQKAAAATLDTPESRACAERERREEEARLALPQLQADLRSLGLPSGFFDGAESETRLRDFRKGGDARLLMLVDVLFKRIRALEERLNG